ncbi:condensation domain-containing protein, partial [Streptomyces bambusae]|uniref:condensation domain-containing protein n=1 Tax=Streptomyces bambusae TaxID=1550616 RepID=UPI0027E0F106
MSWRVLLPDLAQAYEGVELEPVGTSFRRWAEQLTALDRSAELPLWQAQLTGAEPQLGARALDPATDTAETVRHLSLTLPSEVTAGLLTEVAAKYRATVNDVLLTGFALAVSAWRGGSSTEVLVDMEGHGREAVVDGADVSRTVGWFTSMFPVRLDAGTGTDLGRSL